MRTCKDVLARSIIALGDKQQTPTHSQGGLLMQLRYELVM